MSPKEVNIKRKYMAHKTRQIPVGLQPTSPFLMKKGAIAPYTKGSYIIL